MSFRISKEILSRREPNFDRIPQCKDCPHLVIVFIGKYTTCRLNDQRYHLIDNMRGMYGTCRPDLCDGGTKHYKY